jgi:hypothetical protein
MVDENKAFHIADGGYYDNHGVASAIDFLRDILPVYEDDFRNGAAADESVQSGRKSKPTVILVQIRSGETKNASAKPRRGYRYALTGPIDTLMKVRTASQISRNDVELKLLQDLWADRVDIKTWVFNLGGVDAPLSWHLTEADTAAIEAGWTETHRKQLAAIKSILTTGG